MWPPADPQAAEAALDALSCEQTEAQLIQAGADIAQVVTGSRIAYLHFLNEDQDTIELGAWSRDTRQSPTASTGVSPGRGAASTAGSTRMSPSPNPGLSA